MSLAALGRRLGRHLVARTARRDDESGQTALAIVLGLAALIIATPTALVVTSSSATVISQHESYLAQAQQAAQAGITDYVNRIEGTSGVSYASSYCSKTTFSSCTVNPDTTNPAFQNTFDPSCATSAWNRQVSGSDTWQLVQGTGSGTNAEFQYLVDSHQAASKSLVWVYSTGRAGTSGHYTCATQKAALQLGSTSVPPPVLTSCASSVSFTLPGTGTVTAQITLTGAAGGTGGTTGVLGTILLPGVAGTGGLGGEVQTTFTGQAGTTIYVILGCTGGVYQGGSGFSSGGSSVQLGNEGHGGGGGGASAICLTSTCNTTTAQSNVLAIASGGGGGGEGTCVGSQGGNGGAGGQAGLAGVLFNLGRGTILTGAGGAAGSGNTWNPSAMAGSNGYVAPSMNGQNGHSGSDGGGGGGGFAGGGGGQYGTLCGGGGGGGGGSSWVNTSPASPWAYGGSVTYSTSSTGIASAQITVTESGTTIGNYTVGGCGTTAAAIAQVTMNGTVTVQLSGGAGSNGSSNGGWLLQGGNSQGGTGSQVTATVPVIGGDYLYVFIGCPAYGYGSSAGGAGWSSGGSSSSNGGGGGGGASAICEGTSNTAPTAANCATGANKLLLVAGGGGGGGETMPNGPLCTLTSSGGDGGSDGTSANGSAGDNGQNSGGAGGAGGTSGSGSLAVAGATGTVGGGGGGGGYAPGSAGSAGTTCGGLLTGAGAGGGGSGASWVTSSGTGISYQAASGAGGTISFTSATAYTANILASVPAATGAHSW